MHIKRLSQASCFALALTMVISLVPSSVVLAASNTIYVTPASQSVQTGNTFSIQVKGRIEAPAYGGQSQVFGSLTFPANLLRVTSVSQAGATMTNQTAPSINNTGGTVDFRQSASTFIAGQIHIMTVSFQAIASGTAPLGFSSSTNYGPFSTAMIRTGGSVSITTPPPVTCPAGQIGTPPNCKTPPPASCPTGQVGTPPNCKTPPASGGGSTPTPSTPTVSDTTVPTPTAQPDVAPVQVDAGDLSIKDVAAKVTRQSNAVTWGVTLSDATTEIALGTSKENLTVKPAVTKQPDGTYVSSMDNLKPGVRYYFTITATAKDNPEKKATFSGAFTTRGYPVLLVVTQNGKKIPGATIVIEKQNFKTDKNGALSLELNNDTFNTTITLPDNKTKKNVTFTVAKKTIPDDGSNPETQAFTFEVAEEAAATTTPAPSSNLLLGIGGAAVLGTLLVGGALFLLYRRRKAAENVTPVTASEPYTWEQGSSAPEPQSGYFSLATQQQSVDVAAVEQQYIPEAEPQIAGGVYDKPAVDLVPADTSSLPSQDAEEVQHSIATEGELTAEANTYNTQPETTSYVGNEPLVSPSPSLQPSSVQPPETFETQQIENTSEGLLSNQIDTSSDTTNTSNEEEAIYHPETGVFDIIHNHHSEIPTRDFAESLTMPQLSPPDMAIVSTQAPSLPLPSDPASSELNQMPTDGLPPERATV